MNICHALRVMTNKTLTIGQAISGYANAIEEQCFWNRTYIVDFNWQHISKIDERHGCKTIESNFNTIGSIPSTIFVLYYATFIVPVEKK